MARVGAIKGSQGHIVKNFMSLCYGHWKLSCSSEEPLEDFVHGFRGASEETVGIAQVSRTERGRAQRPRDGEDEPTVSCWGG